MKIYRQTRSVGPVERVIEFDNVGENELLKGIYTTYRTRADELFDLVLLQVTKKRLSLDLIDAVNFYNESARRVAGIMIGGQQ